MTMTLVTATTETVDPGFDELEFFQLYPIRQPDGSYRAGYLPADRTFLQDDVRVGLVDMRFDNVTYTNRNNGQTHTLDKGNIKSQKWDDSVYADEDLYPDGKPHGDDDLGMSATAEVTKVRLPPQACPYIFQAQIGTGDQLNNAGGRLGITVQIDIESAES